MITVDVILSIFQSYKTVHNLNNDEIRATKHITIIRTEIINKAEEYEDSNLNNIDKLICVSYLIFMKEHIKSIIHKINYLDSIPEVEQRSPEWYAQRYNLISASSISKVLGTENARKGLLLEKIGIPSRMLSNDAIIHGTIFEIVSQTLYETRNNIKIKEYGCIPHKEHNFIGASPDGVVYNIDGFNMYNINYDTLAVNDIPEYVTVHSFALFGNLLEIKNPYSRTINNTIKFEYEQQITAQQEVCDLLRCDFLENKYDFYDTLDAFLEDNFEFETINALTIPQENKYIKNHTVPLNNLNKEGCEKGILLRFSNMSNSKHEGILFDMKTLYTKESIMDWISEKTKEFEDKGIFKLININYWSVNVYSVKECMFNITDWNKLLLHSRTLWHRILEERLLSDKEIRDKYDLESSSCEINTNKRTSTEYKERDLKKKSKNNNYSDRPKMIYNF
jgi:putative phage-type endonuclease